MSEIHPTAAEGFEMSAPEYERGRPGYPGEAVDFLIEKLVLGRACAVVDLAAGTGKLTRELLTSEAFVIAAEPLGAMRAELAKVLPHVPIVAAAAEYLPFESGSIDAVVVANAWHWFDSRAATSEACRVLRPGGRLGIVYNRRDESVEWVARLSEIIDEHRGSTPQYRSGRWREGLEETSLFGPLHKHDFAWEQALTPDLLRDRVASMSFIARLDRDDRDRVLRVVDRLAVDQFGERPTFTMPYITEVYTTTRA